MNEAVLPGHLRPQGLYVAGNPGYGKSSLIQHLALRDIRAGRGVCVIDPTGDLNSRIIHWIPRSRAKDTIYFNTSHPIPLDIFSYRDADERRVLSDELVGIFDLSNAPRAKPLLRQIIGTLFDANENPLLQKPEAAEDRCTFLDIRNFITQEKRRNVILDYCSPERRRDWDPFPKPSEFEAITYRLIPFAEDPALRIIVGTKDPKLNIWDVMQTKKILLIDLQDTETDLFIGSLIVAKFQQAAFRRRIVPESKRIPFYLYIDEFNTIIKYALKDFEKILTRARKYKLCLTLANPIPQDLPDEILRKLGIFGALMLFNLDTNNARIFKDRIRPYEIDALVNLPKFRALARVNNRVFTVETPRYLESSPASYAQIIRKRTIETYGSSSRTPMHYRRDGEAGTRSDNRDDEIEGIERAKISPNKGKARRARGPH